MCRHIFIFFIEFAYLIDTVMPIELVAIFTINMQDRVAFAAAALVIAVAAVLEYSELPRTQQLDHGVEVGPLAAYLGKSLSLC